MKNLKVLQVGNRRKSIKSLSKSDGGVLTKKPSSNGETGVLGQSGGKREQSC